MIRDRKALGRPLGLHEVATAADYARARHRIDMLATVARSRRTFSGPMSATGYLTAVRALEAATRTSRTLAIDLGLIPQPESP